MKRIFILFAMLSLAVGCKDLYGPEQTSTAPDKAAGVEISISDVADNSFTVVVAPTGEASYYSYLVEESAQAKTLNASQLYAKKYTGVAQAAVKYATSPSTTVKLSSLKPNTTYQVYAVAGSPDGVVGEIVSKSVTTSDGVNPRLTGANAGDGEVTLSFSEAVTLGEGDITIRYFAKQKGAIKNDVEDGTYTLPEENITVSGSTVTLKFEGELHPGACYSVDYPAGMFLDSAENPVAALQSGYGLDEEGALASYGVTGRMDFGTFALAELDMEVCDDPEYLFVFEADDAFIGNYGEGTASFSYTKDGRTVTNPLVAKTDYALGANAEGDVVVYLMLPEAPDYGSTVTISFEEDAFWDIWGNSSEAYETEFLFSFGYTLDDITGYYEGAYYCAFDGKWYSTFLKVEESNNPDKGNVMITDGFSSEFKFIQPLYATFDVNGGTLSIASGSVFGTFMDAYGVAFFVSDNSAQPVSKTSAVFDVPEAGVIQGGGLCGFMFFDLETGSLVDWYDVSGGFDLVRVEEPSATATAAVNNFAKHIPMGTLLNK